MFSIFRLCFFGVPDSVSSFAVLQFAKMDGFYGHFCDIVDILRIIISNEYY